MEMFKIEEVRCNFPNLSTPKGTPDKPDDLKYSITIFLDKKKDKAKHAQLVNFITQQINSVGAWSAAKKKAIANEALTHVNGEMLNKFAIIKDGDALNNALLEDDKKPKPEQAGKWVVSIRNRRAPQVVDAARHDIMGSNIESAIRSGYWVNVVISAYTWAKPDQNGVTIQLQGVQLLRKDEEFGRVDCGFEAVEDADEESGSFDE